MIRRLVGLAGKQERAGKRQRRTRENSSARYVPVGLKGGVKPPTSSSLSSSSASSTSPPPPSSSLSRTEAYRRGRNEVPGGDIRLH